MDIDVKDCVEQPCAAQTHAALADRLFRQFARAASTRRMKRAARYDARPAA